LASNLNYIFGRSFLDKIFYKFFDDEQELINSFLEGKVDLIEVQDYLTAEKLYQVLKNEIRIFTSPRPEKKVYFILFNVNSFPFNDSRIRSAIRRGINRKEIISRIVSYNGHEAYSIIDYSNNAFYKELSKDVYQPMLSMQTLNKRGWEINKTKGTLERNGNVLSFDLLYEKNSFLEESIARSVKINMAELGINVQPKPINIFEKEKVIDQNKFTAVLMNYSYFENSLFDAVLDFYFDILNNADGEPNYKNQNMEQLFTRAGSQLDLQKNLLQQIQIILHRESPAVFLFFDDKIIYAVNNRFQNIRVSFRSSNEYFYRLVPFENWFVPKALQKYPSR
jgi:peptide/nickel transport system substrate-binding protein